MNIYRIYLFNVTLSNLPDELACLAVAQRDTRVKNVIGTFEA